MVKWCWILCFIDVCVGEGNCRGIIVQDVRNGDVFFYLNIFIYYMMSLLICSKNGEKCIFIMRFGVEKCFLSKINR